MKIALCDDDINILNELEDYLKGKAEIYIYNNVELLLQDSQDNACFDIVFLDIKLDNVNGIKLASFLKKQHPEMLFVFMTGYYQYVYDVFEVQPVGFLRKPLKEDDIECVFQRAAKLCDNKNYLEYNIGRTYKRIYLKRIVYLESSKRKIHIVYTEGEDYFYGKMDEIDKYLCKISNNFWRINQSVIINSRYIKEINNKSVIIEKHTGVFSISRAYQFQVHAKLIESIKE